MYPLNDYKQINEVNLWLNVCIKKAFFIIQIRLQVRFVTTLDIIDIVQKCSKVNKMFFERYEYFYPARIQ